MYRIAVKIERVDRKKRSTGVLHVLAGLFLFVNAGQYAKLLGFRNLWLLLPVFAIAVLSVIYGLLRNRIDATARYNHWLRGMQAGVFFVLAVLFFLLKTDIRGAALVLWGLISVLLLFTEQKLFAGAALQFYQNHIHLPGPVWDKKIEWNNVEDVSVRPDFITFHLINNRYRQYELLHELKQNTLESLQDFCRTQVSKTAAISKS